MTPDLRLSPRFFQCVAIMGLSILTIASPRLTMAQQFETAHSYKAGTYPNQAAVGDFNNDGYQDLAVTNTGSGSNGSVSVLLANPNGTFGTAVNYTTVGKPGGIAVGDFNHDGKQDLAVATDHGPNILLGNGDGTFKPAVNYSPASYMTSVVVGDFNGDGNPDLMLCGQEDIYFFAGKSDGTFQTGVLLVSGNGNSYGPLAAADLNRDGKLDLVTLIAGSNPGLVTVFLGNGNGTLQTAVNYQVGTYPQALVLADFNGDGNLDVAVAECASYTQCAVDDPISLLLGNGDGTFQKAQTFKAATDQSAVSIAAADFNGDGKMDLITANDYSGDVSELLGNGNGTFKRAQNWATGQGPHFVVVGDFNHDGVPDVATVSSLGNVTVLLGTKGGSFRAARDFIDNTQPHFVTAGDFNGDGILDLAVANNDAGSLMVMLGQKGGTFSAPVTYTTSGTQNEQIIVADLNGDGHPDLVALGNSSTAISVLIGNGDGTFKPAVNYNAGGSSTGVAVGDFNGDGIPDIAVANPGTSTYGAVSLMIGNGDGTFKPAVTISDGNNYPQLLVAGDVNGDGKLDLVVLNGGEPGYVGTLLGNGDGTFRPLIAGPLAGPYPTIPVLADLNGDGKLDLVVTNYLQPTNNVNVIFGNGDGTFQTAVPYSVGQDSVAVAVADFNGDGIPDLAIANAGTTQGTGSAVLLIGTGGGVFRAGPVLSAGAGPYSLVAGDFNGDGKTDLAVANVGSDNITILLNITP